MSFQQWVAGVISARFGTSTALANALDMKLTVFTRGVSAGTFSVVNLLRLAKVTSANASDVLRLGGKPDVAELIEELYGKAELTGEQREWLSALEGVPKPMRAATLDLVRGTALLRGGQPRERDDETAAEHRTATHAGRKVARRR